MSFFGLGQHHLFVFQALNKLSFQKFSKHRDSTLEFIKLQP